MRPVGGLTAAQSGLPYPKASQARCSRHDGFPCLAAPLVSLRRIQQLPADAPLFRRADQTFVEQFLQDLQLPQAALRN